VRIAVVHDTVYPFFKGGAQKRVYELARRLVQRGHDVHWYGMDYGIKENAGIQMHAVSPAYDLYNNEGKRFITQAIKFGMRLNIQEKVDIIDCVNFPYLHCFRAKASSMQLHAPLVMLWFEYWGKYWYEYLGKIGLVGKIVEQMVTRLPDMIVPDSEKVKKQLTDVGVKPSKIRIIPDGADIKLINTVEPSKDKCDVIYVGRIMAHKNVELLIKAVAGMRDTTLTVIGTGINEKSCRNLSTDFGVDKRIRFLGHVEKDEDVYALMKSAKVLVLPSVQEGHPHVIPEANCCGIPVITIKGTCDEFINTGVNGYISPLHEYPLQLLMERALGLYPRFRKPCIEDAKQYDWDILTDRIEAVYREVL